MSELTIDSVPAVQAGPIRTEFLDSPGPFRPLLERIQISSAVTKAFLAAQKALKPALKDAKNDHLKSKYADLASVWEACRDALHDNGLAVTQVFAHREGGVCVITRIYHAETGYEMPPSECYIPVDTDPTRSVDSRTGAEKVTAKNFAQAYGSTATYARRYGLAAMMGVVTEDDDGNGAGGSFRPQKPAATGGGSKRPATDPVGIAIALWQNGPHKEALKQAYRDEYGESLPKFSEMSGELLDWCIVILKEGAPRNLD